MDQHPQDHDILVRLTEKVDNLVLKVSNLTDDHENRIRFLEKWVWVAVGVTDVVLLIIGYYISIKFH